MQPIQKFENFFCNIFVSSLAEACESTLLDQVQNSRRIAKVTIQELFDEIETASPSKMHDCLILVEDKIDSLGEQIKKWAITLDEMERFIVDCKDLTKETKLTNCIDGLLWMAIAFGSIGTVASRSQNQAPPPDPDSGSSPEPQVYAQGGGEDSTKQAFEIITVTSLPFRIMASFIMNKIKEKRAKLDTMLTNMENYKEKRNETEVCNGIKQLLDMVNACQKNKPISFSEWKKAMYYAKKDPTIVSEKQLDKLRSIAARTTQFQKAQKSYEERIKAVENKKPPTEKGLTESDLVCIEKVRILERFTHTTEEDLDNGRITVVVESGSDRVESNEIELREFQEKKDQE